MTYVSGFGSVTAMKLPKNLRAYLATLGRKGGLKGGKARAARMTAKERTEAARKAVQARWAKAKKAEKQKPSEGR